MMSFNQFLFRNYSCRFIIKLNELLEQLQTDQEFIQKENDYVSQSELHSMLNTVKLFYLKNKFSRVKKTLTYQE